MKEILIIVDMQEGFVKSEEMKELLADIDVIIDKYYYSGVTDELLAQLKLNNNGELPDRVFLMGVDTDCCVLSTAISLFERNIRPVVLAEYTASTGRKEAHMAGIRCMERLIGKKQICREFEITKDILERV